LEKGSFEATFEACAQHFNLRWKEGRKEGLSDFISGVKVEGWS
jgi:hypothetical protein